MTELTAMIGSYHSYAPCSTDAAAGSPCFSALGVPITRLQYRDGQRYDDFVNYFRYPKPLPRLVGVVLQSRIHHLAPNYQTAIPGSDCSAIATDNASAPALTTTEKMDASSHNSELSANATSNDNQKETSMPTLYTPNDSQLGKGRPSRSQWKLLQPESHPFRPLALGFYLPFKLFCFPIVVFATFAVSFSSTCYLMITFIQSQAFAVPPYSFNQQFIGFMNFASLIGTLIGLFTAGPLSDWVSAKLTQRNNGIREPEMRLLTMIPYVLVMLLENFVVAFGLQNDWDWRASSFSLL